MTFPRHPEARCGRCAGPNVTWSAPSPLWNQVMRGGDIGGDDLFDGIVCPTCFAQLAEQAGVAQFWRLDAQKVHMGLQTVTPSGRIWNPDTWMWQDPAEVGSMTAADKELAKLKDAVNRATRRLLHTSQHNRCVVFIGGRIQDDIGELRAAAGLPEFRWDASIPDQEVQRCSVHSDGCEGQHTHTDQGPR